MSNKNQSRARFRAERRKLKKERKHFRIHNLSFLEVVFFYDGEEFAFGYDIPTKRTFRQTNSHTYPHLSPEAAAFLYDQAEEIFEAQWRGMRDKQRNKKRNKGKVLQMELPFFA